MLTLKPERKFQKFMHCTFSSDRTITQSLVMHKDEEDKERVAVIKREIRVYSGCIAVNNNDYLLLSCKFM